MRSPGRTDAGETRHARESGGRCRDVVMYIRSALPCSTTLVSPPAMITSGALRGSGHGAHFGFQHLRRQSGFEHIRSPPASAARAPDTARSFTVPLTASSPMEPPGKRSGLTTKLSVVMAKRVPLISRCAASPRGSADCKPQQRSEQILHQAAAGLASGAVRHFDLRIAKADLGKRRGHAHRPLLRSRL